MSMAPEHRCAWPGCETITVRTRCLAHSAAFARGEAPSLVFDLVQQQWTFLYPGLPCPAHPSELRDSCQACELVAEERHAALRGGAW
jgi:hypothetical protein